MDIGIFIEFEGEVVQIPVNPENFEVTTSGNNETMEIIALGEIVIPKKKSLSTISWESFFPYESWFPGVRTKGGFKSYQFYVDFINKIWDSCKPCLLSVTGIGYDEYVVVESFDYNHQAGDHEDRYYSIELKRYEPHGVSIIAKDVVVEEETTTTTTTTTSVGTASPQAAVTPEPKEITIGCDVILNGRVHYDSYGSKPGKTFTNYKGKVNLMNKKGSHPYHVTTPSGGWLGWVTTESVVLA